MEDIIVLYVGKEPKVESHDLSLKTMQGLVNGYIEVVPLCSEFVLVCNEEGKLQDLEPNFALKMSDVVCGDAFICKSNGENLIGLTDDDILYLECVIKRNMIFFV
jgi:hypothetical protein